MPLASESRRRRTDRTTSAGGKLVNFAEGVDEHIREGRFQRSLSLLAGLSSVLSGLEVAYEHYRGSYSRRIMYTPVILSGALLGAGLWAFKSKQAAKTVLPVVSVLTLADCAIGFYFHVRGVSRKPGGWRLPLVNMVMGPPVFAPLLFGTSAYLGLIAHYFRREDHLGGSGYPLPAHSGSWAARLSRGGHHEAITWKQDLREGRFQRHMAAATAIAAFFSGFEAWYSHYKSGFRYKAQWTPVVIAPALMLSAVLAIKSRKAAHTWLPAMSALALGDGLVGFVYHARWVARRPGGLKMPLYNIMYGPPIFAPLLFAACGFIGVLASLLRRDHESFRRGRRTSPARRSPDRPTVLPSAQPGYYPGFSTLAQQKFWDEATRAVVLDRLNEIPPVRFFTAEEADLMTAVCDRIIPQDDRDHAHRIPIMPFIDKRLHDGRIDGYRYEQMPPDREAHRLGLKAIQLIARHVFGTGFIQIAAAEQEQVLKTIQAGDPPAAHDIWRQMPVHRYWMLLVQRLRRGLLRASLGMG